MKKIIKFSDYLKLYEDGEGGGGGGVAFATANQNGMGNIVSPQVGSTTGSLWQGGCGTIGSGDRAAYDVKKNKFDFIKNKKKKNKVKNSFKEPSMKKFSDWLKK
jgi:hypothetical protein